MELQAIVDAVREYEYLIPYFLAFFVPFWVGIELARTVVDQRLSLVFLFFTLTYFFGKTLISGLTERRALGFLAIITIGMCVGMILSYRRYIGKARKRN